MGWFNAAKIFLISIAPTLAAKVMTALGVGVVSYAALSGLSTAIISSVNASYGGIGDVPLAFLNLSGFGTAISIILSAITVRVSLTALKKFIPI